MLVVVRGTRNPEIVPRVDGSSLVQREPEERDKREDVGVEEVKGKRDGEHVCEEVLDGVCVLCRERDGCDERVVLLVNPGVQGRQVQRAVRIVKENLPAHASGRKLAHEARERGKRRRDGEGGVREPWPAQRIQHAQVQHATDQRPSQDGRDTVLDFGGRRLPLLALNLVCAREAREGEVDEEVERGGNVEEQELRRRVEVKLHEARGRRHDKVAP